MRAKQRSANARLLSSEYGVAAPRLNASTSARRKARVERPKDERMLVGTPIEMSVGARRENEKVKNRKGVK